MLPTELLPHLLFLSLKVLQQLWSVTHIVKTIYPFGLPVSLLSPAPCTKRGFRPSSTEKPVISPGLLQKTASLPKLEGQRSQDLNN